MKKESTVEISPAHEGSVPVLFQDLVAGVDPVEIPVHHVEIRLSGEPECNALDSALRQGLSKFFPKLRKLRLTDYKVRVINSKDETAARVRVIIECRRDKGDGTKELFGTIGVSENVIDASWQALVDAYEYHLILTEEQSGAGA